MSRLAHLTRAAGESTTAVRAVAAAVVVLLLAGFAALARPAAADTVTVTAHFPRAVGLYEGSDVRILGVKVGRVLEVEPEGTSVRVRFAYAAKHKVPADAKAAVVAPSVVSDRYVQLLPVYRGGPVLADGADIPLDQTATPVELDRIFSSLNDLNVALGPQGANKEGALTRLLKVGADNLDGQGAKIHDTLHDFSTALTTLAEGKDDLFGTLQSLQIFTTALAKSDAQVRAFNQDLAQVADQLAAERDELSATLKNLAVALSEVSTFVRDNRADLTASVQDLAEVTSVLRKQKAALAEALESGPLALSNLNLAYNPKSGTLDTRNNAQHPSAGEILCSVLTEIGQGDRCDEVDDLLKELEKGLPAAAGPAAATGAVSYNPTLGGILAGEA
jgi:phospholipid/cholesterol/gamma-HCH transport system substrate-binding protein